MPKPFQGDIDHQIRRTLKDSLIYAPANVIPAVVGILLIRVLTSVFTPEEYGYYQITLTTFGLVRVFSMVWLAQSVTRFYLKYKNSNQESLFFSTLFLCALLGTVSIALLGWGVNFFVFKQRISPPLFPLINLAIAASVVNAFFEIFIMVFRAGLEPKKYSLFWILFAVGKPFFGIGCIFLLGFRVEGIFWAFLIVPLVLDFIVFKKIGLFSLLRFRNVSKPLIGEFFRYGVPLSFSALSFWMLSLSDRYLLGFFRTSGEVGLYSVGYLISEKTLNFVYMILMLAAYPIIIDNWEKHGKDHTQRLITEMSRIFFLVCTPILMVMISVPKLIFRIFSDVGYIGGAKVLPLIAGGVFLYGLSQYVLKGFELYKKSTRIAVIAVFSGVVNIVINCMLIPAYGILGAAISAFVSYTVYFIFAIFMVRNYLVWKPPYPTLLRVLTASVVSGILLSFLVSRVGMDPVVRVCMIPIGLSVFVILLLLQKEISKEDILSGFEFLRGVVVKDR